LADFGIAKAEGLSEKTRTGVLKGKLAYMSPEQAKAGRVPITPRSDLFAAGLVFWECITCERLFQATTEHQILAQVLSFDKVSLPYYSNEINTYLGRLLAPDPADRFASAEVALNDLRRIGIQPCTALDVAQMIRQLQRHKENEGYANAHQLEYAEQENAYGQRVVSQPLSEPTKRTEIQNTGHPIVTDKDVDASYKTGTPYDTSATPVDRPAPWNEGRRSRYLALAITGIGVVVVLTIVVLSGGDLAQVMIMHCKCLSMLVRKNSNQRLPNHLSNAKHRILSCQAGKR
jgi:serine/threonine protein kinase